MRVSQELELASLAVKELEPAVREFTAKIAGAPGVEVGEMLADRVRLRRYLAQLKILEKAKLATEAAGLPVSAVPTKILAPLLELGSLEDDDEMVQRWANLLANAATAPERGHVAFPGVLAQLEPTEARLLDAMHAALADELHARVASDWRLIGFDPGFFESRCGVDRFTYARAAANLRRLQLVDPTGRRNPPHVMHTPTNEVLSTPSQLTYFGAAFVDALQIPSAERLTVAMVHSLEPDSPAASPSATPDVPGS